MNVSDVWDWPFFWSMFRNFVASAAPFLMIPAAVLVVGMLMNAIVSAVSKGKG
ncbi:PTS ascorbate transporter subunit IIC [Paenibacillus sp. YN15]|uniref:PTS ascorbate transporter subunit IIC n=1 Tax=Paenibacillus sp. YN15 TaxID=1742774 RepID=UPI000DCC15F8|nr:PTS ascorbate transporter subunit IIC [Paenibacillus sp. YN15]RAU92493.1 PTS ascorbate transporter subunit IIC [Paenibacillus sp. YN15]